MTNKTKVVLDTCVFMHNLEEVKAGFASYEYVICSTVADELDKHKESESGVKSAKARNALRFIEENATKFEFAMSDNINNIDVDGVDVSNSDTKILSVALYNGYSVCTIDRGMWIRAKALNIPIIEIKQQEESFYKGYKTVELDSTNEYESNIIADFYSRKDVNMFDLEVNQYLILKDCGKVIDVQKWTGSEHVSIKNGNKRDGLVPKNALQQCAIDLLMDESIPIKIVAGTFGSGKTYLSTKLATWHIKKGNYGKIMVIRNPIGGGKEIGFLPGSKDEKISDFFKPFVQHLDGGEFEAARMEQQGTLEKEIPFYCKGLSWGSTFVYVDEAEDLTLKDIKLLGSRIEETSCICFTGDYKQAEKGYHQNNGLMHVIQELKGNPLVGIVVLEEDVRSCASKVFADL